MPDKSQQHVQIDYANWDNAVAKTALADPFCSRTEWQLSYHEVMQPESKLIIRECPGSVVALSKRPGKKHINQLLPIDSSWQYGCPLLGPDALDLLDNVIADEISPSPKHPVHRTAILLSGLETPGELRNQIIRKYQDDYDIRLYQTTTLCNASLKNGLDGYLSRRSSTHRRSLKKQSRRANNLGVTFEQVVPKSEAEVKAIYQRMLAVEEASWKGIGQCGMAEQPSRDYYLRMLTRMSVTGMGRIIMACHEGKDIGFIFGGVVDGIYRGQQFSFDDEWKSQSIGNLLQLEQIRWLCEEGATRYDMGPLMGYKHHWTENQPEIQSLVLFKKM